MPHTTTAATKESRTGRPAHAAPARRTPTTAADSAPVLHGLILLFAPTKNGERP